MKFSIKDFFSKYDQIRSFLTFTEEILNGKLAINALNYKTYRTDLKFRSSYQQCKRGEYSLRKLLKKIFAS